MAVQGRHRQVMMRVLQAGQPLGQFTLVVVEHVGQVAHAVPGRRVALPVALDSAADQVAHRLRTAAVAPRCDQRIEPAARAPRPAKS
jgi:hypothetical protein